MVKRSKVASLLCLLMLLFYGISIAGPTAVLLQSPSLITWVLTLVIISFGMVNTFLGFFLKRYISKQDEMIHELFEMRNMDHDNLTKLRAQHDCAMQRPRPCDNCDALTRSEVREIVAVHG